VLVHKGQIVHARDRTANRGGAAAIGRRTGCAPLCGYGDYPALHETVGQVQLPLAIMVTPKLFPLPLGLPTMTCALGQVALTFQVAEIRAGEGTFIVTVQLLVPETATLRL
jgi:hypothetical protein